MKKKQKIGFFILLILALVSTFFGSYYFSKKNASKNNDIIYSDNKNITPVDAVSEEIIKTDAQVVYEIYKNGKKTKEEILQVPGEFVGKSRTGLLAYMEENFETLSVEEKQKGLEDMELISFSKDRVVIRKHYGDALPYTYVLYIENSMITVYYCDRKTIYSYTDIKAEDLPENIRKELYNGKTIESTAALYDFLETYSS